MHKLSQSIERKFIDSINVVDWEIETDTGWEDISSIHKTIEYEEWEIETLDGLKLIGADTHILFDENFNEVFIKDLIPGISKIKTKYGDQLVTKIHNRESKSNMYDITVNSNNHRFYSNNILSHNTTTAVVVILHYVLFNESKTVALLANKGDAAREILDRIKIAYEALPKWLQQGVTEWNKGSVTFENGCKIIAASTSSSAIRGKSVSFLYIDECAFVENWDLFFASVFPTISSGVTTKVLFTSTPNGLNHFWKICSGAKEKGDEWNGYEYVEVSWDKVPGRDEKWKTDILSSINWDYQMFACEFCCEFMGSSGTLISGNVLQNLVAKTPIKYANNVKIYEESIKGNTYIATVDVSRGKGLDYSTIQVFDISKMPYKQVCSFRDNTIPPIELAEIIHRIAKSYNDCGVLVEINDIGGQVSDLLYYDFEYENVLCTETAGRSGKRISGGFGKNVDRGIRTTKTVKSIGCSMLKLLIEQSQLIINDQDTINELSTFSRKGVSYEAESGCHDDLVMGLVLFAWVSSMKYFKEMTDINTLSQLRENSEERIYAELLPVGVYDDGIVEEVMSNTISRSRDPWDIGMF